MSLNYAKDNTNLIKNDFIVLINMGGANMAHYCFH